jgi:hypothetical protein
MSTQPLSPAEQAAAEALADTLNGHERVAGNVDCWTAADFADEARAVVAAVEQPIAIAALESAATALDELAATNARVGRGTAEGPWIAAGVQGAALHVRNLIRARQSLSRPTSEEH